MSTVSGLALYPCRMRHLVLVASLVACNGPSSTDSSPGDGDSDVAGDSDTDTDADSDADSDADTDADADAAMCARWNTDRDAREEGAWTGNVSSCDAGEYRSPGPETVLTQVNLMRFLADLPAVDDDAAKSAGAQECALMMKANGQLNHFPPPEWACYSDSGASTAGQSNIASAAGVYAIDMYMGDWGNPTTIGHRRWILSNSLGPIGIGSTDSTSCLWVLYGSGNAGAAWTAWPAPGPFPLEAAQLVDSTGWSIQSDGINLGSATVTVTDGSTEKPVTVVQLAGGYGSSYAISVIPSGWTAQAGHTYHVEVGNVAQAIAYDVDIVDCGAS
jgi:hypothetical protein